MALFKLPPEIRLALARSIYGLGPSLTQSILPLVAHNAKVRNHSPLELGLVGRRKYATVNIEDTTKLWSQHGKDPPSEASIEVKPAKKRSNASKALPENDSSPAATTSETTNGTTASTAGTVHTIPKKTPRARRKAKSMSKGKQQILTAPTNQSENQKEIEKVELLDLKYIQNNLPLPNKEEYPNAGAELFNPVQAVTVINNACQKLKISLQTEVDFSAKPGMTKGALQRLQNGLREVFVCNLKVEIPDICSESAVGEGVNKQAAKQAAWLYIISKMHTTGMLKELFPSESYVPRSQSASALEASEPVVEPVEVDNETMKEEKDAKIEIYNYAARHGLVPVFESNIIQPRRPRARLGRTPKQPTPLHEVKIRLDGLGINVSAISKTLPTAEIAAAIAFKKEAEQKQQDSSDAILLPQDDRFSVLSVDTAGQFFEFYKNRAKGLNLEVEYDTLEGPATQNSATLTINDEKVGQSAIMPTKAKAASIAYLTAAVAIAKFDPKLLAEFVQSLRKGKGKILRSLNSVDFQIGYEAIETMRNALIEARDSGLSDSRQALSAEHLVAADESRQRSRRLSPQEHKDASRYLQARQQHFDNDPNLAELRSKKTGLPMNTFREEVLQMVNHNQYSIIVGATGSGKTTQVPQILFEQATANAEGSSCNIICTQPRRIAATSVAQRVAVERDEPLRQTVGYHVRFDPKLPEKPYGITYCTTGILLEKLKHYPDGVLDSTSHIIIDEVHERDLNIDFLMIVLKRAIRIRQANGQAVPTVVLMSATLDSDLFANYFRQVDSNGTNQPCPTLNVPGRTYPVKEKYLGTIMHELLNKHGAQVKTLLDEDKSREYLTVETEFSKTQSQRGLLDGKDSVIDWKSEWQPAINPEEDLAARQEKEEALVPVSLLTSTIAHICSTTSEGAILAFLPGLEEIVDAQNSLLHRRPLGVDFSDQKKYEICILHSAVPKEQQSAIFKPSPPGCRKIILSTNIAETSVTVPEVRYIVDTGKLREKRYDQVRRITKLQCVWESKSNSKQRAGRAGRVQDGFYYALFSKERSNALRAVGLPELLRSDLQETCLSIKSQNFVEPVPSFLAQAIEPPSAEAVDVAIRNLISIEAFTVNQELTALGRVLSQLPVHPSLSKMIILGVIFRCLDPMIVLGVAAEERSLFTRPLGQRQEANRIHSAYGDGSKSDHIAFLRAFNELRTIRDESGIHAATQRAWENFLHMGAFRVIDQNARSIVEILEQAKLIVGGKERQSQYGPADLNRNSQNYELVKALLLAGFNPNLAAKTSSSSISYRTPTEQGVLMHPSSVNAESKKADAKHPHGTLWAYSTLSRSTDGSMLYMRDSTLVTPLMSALFGGQLRMSGDGRLELDEWLPFFVKTYDRRFATRLILEFRKALDRVLNNAFSSLSDLKEGRAADLVSDPMREKFAQRVVEILSYSSGKQNLQDAWAPLGRL